MLSIIIPTLNEEKYLPFLLESIKKHPEAERSSRRGSPVQSSAFVSGQIFNDFEIIIADAGSKDKTIEIAKKFGCQIVKGGLPAKGRNEGAQIAKGDLYLFLDGDTILPEIFFEKALYEFKKRNLDVASFCLEPKTESKFKKL